MRTTVNVKPTKPHNKVNGKQKMCSSRIRTTARKFKAEFKKDWHELSVLDKFRLLAAIIFLAVMVYIVFELTFPIIDSLGEVGETLEPHNFELPIHINLNGTRGFDADISFDLTFNYHTGTLIVDKPINIESTAVFLSKNAENVETVRIWFQNGLAYNTTSNSIIVDGWGIPEHAYLFFNSTQSGIFYPYVWTEEIAIIWTIDGTYHPIIAFTYKDKTESLPMLIDDVAITVYPKEQLTEVQTNIVNIRLSIAVYVLSIFNIITIVFAILPKEKPRRTTTQTESNNLELSKQESQKQPPNKKQEYPKWEI